MPLTAEELVFRATRKARAGLAPSEARVYDDNAYLLIKDAMHELALRAGMNSEKRPLLMRAFAITFTSGKASLASGFDGLLKAHLRWAYLYEPDDIDQLYPYQFRHHLSDLRRKLNPIYGYWAMEDRDTVATRKRYVGGDGALSEVAGNGVLRAIYIPDFVVGTLNVLPAEFDDWAVQILAEMLITQRPAEPKK